MTAVADEARWATVAVEVGMACGKAADACTADPHTASSTTTDYLDLVGTANERMVEGRSVGSQGLGKTGGMDTQNG